MLNLNMDLYLKAFSTSITHKGITGGTIHDFLRESKVTYYGGKCPVWYVEHYYNGFYARKIYTYSNTKKSRY